MNRQIRVDWFRIIHDIKRHGISLYALEEQVRIPKSTLIGYKNGSEPRHTDGERLIEFWCRVTLSEREHLPTEAVHISAAMAK